MKKNMPIIYFILGFLFAAVSFYLSFKFEIGISYRMDVGGGVDIAADGGALGFAIISSICFLCSTYLLRSTEKS